MHSPESNAVDVNLEQLVQVQRSAFLAEGPASLRTRRDRLARALDLLVSHEAELCEAIAADFGQRPVSLTRVMDIFPAVHALRYARRHVGGWMRSRARRLGFPNLIPGVTGEILYQPLGVVGVISPWNFPVTLSFGPLAGILAAGNRCLVKPSELTPVTAELLRKLVAAHFEPAEVSVVTGGRAVAESFARLPFDHLLFTGSTQVGRQVMAAAAVHLVPVTLELGGKCPVILGATADLRRAVDRTLLAKLANSGQMCLAPDHVYVPRQSLHAFIEQARKWTRGAYPGLPGNPDYTSLISPHHLQRVQELLDDARARGAEVVPLCESDVVPDRDSRLVPPALIVGVSRDMRVMREEIFAPLLPVLPYDSMEEVIADIRGREHPLALYYFGADKRELRGILAHTISGGVTVNDVATHFLAEELPFGGVGASGMGSYHGEHGFVRFSHARPVLRQSAFDLAGLLGLRPPYGERLQRCLRWLIRR
ncbi:MAG TPA: coniferyl aldehyde dehydrogenase [Steroidobacteraceae bacterium]|nr:coniferyl aldehyde dehydrogenase [Steroidobacteraceae bacterium]